MIACNRGTAEAKSDRRAVSQQWRICGYLAVANLWLLSSGDPIVTRQRWSGSLDQYSRRETQKQKEV